ncbi:MAG: SCO family protein [Gemmatimonadales bacterium]
MLVAVWGAGPSPSPADTARAVGRAIREQPRYLRSLETYQIPPVVLVDQAGEAVALASALDGGEPVMVNFLFTSCTATCPVATAIVANMRQALGPEGRALKILSISIDPAHDTPIALHAYARRYGVGPGWRLLTGDAAQVRAVLKAFGVSAGKASHTPVTLLKIPGGRHWVRLSGFPNSAELVNEYRLLRGI